MHNISKITMVGHIMFSNSYVEMIHLCAVNGMMNSSLVVCPMWSNCMNV